MVKMMITNILLKMYTHDYLSLFIPRMITINNNYISAHTNAQYRYVYYKLEQFCRLSF